MAKIPRYVIEHGARGHLADAPITQWRDSTAPFTPRYLQGHDAHYETIANVQCTVCGATFTYKGLKPRMSKPLLWFGLILSALMCVIIMRISTMGAIVAMLLEGMFLLLVLMVMFKPRTPYLQQRSGPTRFRHRVRRYP